MALPAAAASANAGMLATIALWEDYIDSLTAGDQVLVVPVRIRQSGVAAGERWGNDASIQWDFASRHAFTRETTVADRFPTHVGNKPLFWMITNAARDLS